METDIMKIVRVTFALIFCCTVGVLVCAALVLPDAVRADNRMLVAAASEQVLVVIGTGGPVDNPALGVPERRLKAQRDAKLDGVRKMDEAVRAVVTDSGATVGELMAGDEKLRRRIDTFIQGARVTGTRYQQDGSVEIDLELDYRALVVIVGGTP
jgi:hypothetical protein